MRFFGGWIRKNFVWPEVVLCKYTFWPFVASNQGEFSVLFFPSMYPKFIEIRNFFAQLQFDTYNYINHNWLKVGCHARKICFPILHFFGNEVFVWSDIINPILESPKETHPKWRMFFFFCS